uniref:ACT domain-containing protein-like n=1 Tax=Oryza sativa subsp. japonica TaxID=39947 RepID=Q6YWR7_ORYSJ|nr:ACT domain-containing protein-like [Oryza sativa Japonica Group]
MGDMSDGAPWSRGEDGVAAGRGGARREAAAGRAPGGLGQPGTGEELAGRPRPAGRREASASRAQGRSSPRSHG